jgi:hypothetical protein
MIHDTGVPLMFAFDSEKPAIYLWGIMADGDAIWQENVKGAANLSRKAFLDKLFACQKLTVSYRLRSGVTKSATFDLSGTNDIIEPLFGGSSVELQ